MILLDALILIVLLKVVNQDDIGFWPAAGVAAVAAIGTGVLVFVLTLFLGIFGLILAAIVAAVLLGIAVSAVFGVEIKRSFLVGGIFMVVHIGLSLAINWFLQP
jgi:hypothetical protein